MEQRISLLSNCLNGCPLLLMNLLRCPCFILKASYNACCCCLKMVSWQGSHKRLQTYQHHYCSVCMTGIFGCRWHRYQQSKESSTKCDIFWFLTLIASFLYVILMLNYWIVNGNSEDLVNWYFFNKFGRWNSTLGIFLALTAVCLSYLLIMFLLSLCHISAGHQIYLHWLHRFVVALVLAGCITVTTLVHSIWSAGWSLMFVSFQISGPFIHIALLFILVPLTWVIARSWMNISCKGWKACWLGMYLVVVVLICVFPPFLDSPCVVEPAFMPKKPYIMAHRGGAAVAPENTLAAFQAAIATPGVITLESDVAVSYDGVPFILHDDTFLRTSDVLERFPRDAHKEACWFNISQIKQLNAGNWFIQHDPFAIVGSLNHHQRAVYANQSVPTLKEYLELAREADINVMFDVKMYDDKSSCQGHPYNATFMDTILKAISQSGIPHKKVLWLYWDTLPTAEYTFTRVASAKLGPHMRDPDHLRQNDVSIVNGQFDHISQESIGSLRSSNISVNMYVVDAPWLFSLYWCAGVHSVTSNQIQHLAQIQKPVWQMTPQEFKIMWITADVLAVVSCAVIFFVQRMRHIGKSFSSDTLTLPPARLMKKSHRTMKEKLLHTADSLQEIDAAGIQGMDDAQSSWASLSTDGIIVEFPRADSQTSGNSGENGVQLHRMSRTSGISGLSGISGISAISGNGVSDGNSTAHTSDSFEKDPNV